MGDDLREGLLPNLPLDPVSENMKTSTVSGWIYVPETIRMTTESQLHIVSSPRPRPVEENPLYPIRLPEYSI